MAEPRTAFFDAAGKEVKDGADAVQGEIEANGIRYYFGSEPMDSLVPVEDEGLLPTQQDALKGGTWDVRRDFDQEPVETFSELIDALGWEGYDVSELRSATCNLLELPAWGPAPKSLKDEVYAWLVATRR